MAFEDPAGIIAASVVLAALSLLAVLARFYSRFMLKAPIRWDDWLVLMALSLTLPLNAVVIYGSAPSVRAFANPSAGNRVSEGDTDKANYSNKLYFTTLCLSVVGLGFLKSSVALLYQRIFSTKINGITWWDRLVRVWIVLIVVWTVAIFLAVVLECGSHISSIWTNSDIANYYRYCSRDLDIYWAFFTTDVAMDIITVLMPLPKVRALHLPLARKIQVALILLVALLSVGASLGMLITYARVYFGLFHQNSITLATTLSVWHMIELNTGIIAACLPACRPVIIWMSQSSSSMIHLISFRSSTENRTQSTGMGLANSRQAEVDSWDLEGKSRARNEVVGTASTSSGTGSHAEVADGRILVRHDISVRGENTVAS